MLPPSPSNVPHNAPQHAATHVPPHVDLDTSPVPPTDLDQEVDTVVSVAKTLNSPDKREPVPTPSSPPNPLDPTLTSVPKTSSSQTSTPSPTKLRFLNPPPEDPTKNKTVKSPREPSISTVPSASPRNTTTHPRDNTPPAKMERVLPKPEPEPRSKTTPAPRPISHAPAPPDPQDIEVLAPPVDADPYATTNAAELFDLVT